jgi:capsular polysaccharide biosynthesis protein
VPQHKSSPNTKKNVAYGGLLGLCLAGGVVVLLYLLDDTIKNKDDVERYLGKNVLASIPVDSVMDENDKEQKKRKRSFGKRKTPMRHSAKA